MTCVSGNNHQVMMTVNNNILSAILTNLRYYTIYNCCVEAIYSDSRENASSCIIGQTQEGRKMDHCYPVKVNHASLCIIIQNQDHQVT